MENDPLVQSADQPRVARAKLIRPSASSSVGRLQPPFGAQGTQASRDAVYRLWRHDLTITWNIFRATFARWPDRLIGASVLIGALAGVHSWIGALSASVAIWIAVAASTFAAVIAGRLVNGRLLYHRTDGLLAADALQSRVRLRYAAAAHAAALLLIAVLMAIARPSLLVATAPGYACGLLIAQLTRGMPSWAQVDGPTRLSRIVGEWSRRPITGIAAAGILSLALVRGRTLPVAVQLALAGSGTMLFGLVLSRVDDGVVRFMTLAGNRFRRIFAHNAQGAAAFISAALLVSWALMGATGTAVVAAAAAAMMLLLALRISAYRLLKKGGADLLIAGLLGLLVVLAYSLPPALPIAGVAMLWHLNRRGRQRRWLIQ